MPDDADRRRRGVDWLLGARDGGWGYRPGATGYVEPTALAIVALLGARDVSPDAASAAESAAAWLRGRQRPDGGWGVSSADVESSWMTAYAVWALATARVASGRAGLSEGVEAGARWLLVDRKSAATAADVEQQRKLLGIDASLVGWSWSPDTASWVFPTAWSVVAAIAAAPENRGHKRVRDGVAYLLDRACAGGGWNFGNPYMVGQAYAPDVVDTSAALLALRAVGEAGTPTFADGRRVLERLVDSTVSALGLGWGAVALSALGAEAAAEGARRRLADLQRSDGSWSGNPFPTALALLALGKAIPLGGAPR